MSAIMHNISDSLCVHRLTLATATLTMTELCMSQSRSRGAAGDRRKARAPASTAEYNIPVLVCPP